MALLITDECINCDVCEPVCPNQAIYLGDEHYDIDPDRCTECVGHFDQPQCASLCPVACIPVDPQRVESRAVLWQRYARLQTEAGQPMPADVSQVPASGVEGGGPAVAGGEAPPSAAPAPD
jgi:Fe-S-cluster-containing hydrogenase component 2